MAQHNDAGRGAQSSDLRDLARTLLTDADAAMLADLLAQVTAAVMDIAQSPDQHGRVEIRLSRERDGHWTRKVEGGPSRRY